MHESIRRNHIDGLTPKDTERLYWHRALLETYRRLRAGEAIPSELPQTAEAFRAAAMRNDEGVMERMLDLRYISTGNGRGDSPLTVSSRKALRYAVQAAPLPWMDADMSVLQRIMSHLWDSVDALAFDAEDKVKLREACAIFEDLIGCVNVEPTPGAKCGRKRHDAGDTKPGVIESRVPKMRGRPRKPVAEVES